MPTLQGSHIADDMKEYHAHAPGCLYRCVRVREACTCGANKLFVKRKEDEAALALRRALGSMKL